MNTFEYRGHTVEIKPFDFHCDHRGVAFPSMHDVFIDKLRRSSGFLGEDDAKRYAQSLIDEAEENRKMILALFAASTADTRLGADVVYDA